LAKTGRHDNVKVRVEKVVARFIGLIKMPDESGDYKFLPKDRIAESYR
jgi:hypothetical protein